MEKENVTLGTKIMLGIFYLVVAMVVVFGVVSATSSNDSDNQTEMTAPSGQSPF